MSGSNEIYSRNADLTAERDAILSLPAEQQQGALLAMSQRRSLVPAAPGGFREPEWARNLSKATGQFAGATGAPPRQLAAMKASDGSGTADDTGGSGSDAGGGTAAPSTGLRNALRSVTGISPGQTALLGGRLDLIDRDAALARRQGEVEQSQRRTIAQGEASASADYAATQRRLAQDLERRLQPIPEFVPTRETARDLGAFASLLMVAGTMLGGKGKQGALMAVGAMTGMMNGYRQGRQDLYQRERQTFETGMRQVETQNRQLQEAFSRAQRLAQTDLEAARSQFQVAALALGATLPNIAAERGSLAAGQQVLQQAGTALAQAEARRDAERARVENGTPLVVPGEREGTFVYVRRDGTPIRDPRGQPLQAPPPRGAGTAAGDRFGFGDIVVGAANEAAASLRNLTSMGSEASTGIFQGRNTTGLMTAPLGALTNALTSDEAQRYNVEIANFGKFLAQVQRGGRTVPVSDIEASQRVFAVREGDSQHTVLTKFAAMRQQLERIIEVRIRSPNTPEPLKEVLRQNLATIQDVVPFSVEDVNRFVNSQNQTATFADMFREVGIVPPAAGEQRPAPRRETPAPAPAAGGNAAPQPSAAPAGQPTRITNDAAGRAAYEALPPGALFIGPDGQTRRKP